MRNEDLNEREIAKLEEDLRKLGTPYALNEPDPLYWANFRVRVMDRIAEKRKKATWPTRVLEFIAEHLIATSIVTAAACLVAAGIIALQTSGTTSEAPPLAAVPAPVQQAPSQEAPITPRPNLAYVAHRSDRSVLANAAKRRNSTEDLATAEPFAASSSEEAVSLQSLSQPELEAVLQGLQSNE